MRQPNRSLPGASRPVEILWPNIYNRAALDVTSTLPLSISLNNLRPMVFNLPQLRQAMTEDGGLEALIDIMSTVRRADDPNEVHVRKLALQCLTQFGIRGPESIRLRTVEAQLVPVLITVLECFWRAMETDIREAIEYGLQPSPPQRPVAGPIKAPQMLTRRRAVTIGSISTPVDRFGGLQIRFTPNRSPLSRQSASDINVSVTDTPPADRTAIVEEQNVIVETDRDRMDIDAPSSNEIEEEGVIEDTMTDAEALRSPPPEEDVSYSSSFVSSENQDASSAMPPNSSPVPRATVIDVEQTLETLETLTVPQADQPVPEQPSPMRTTHVLPVVASSPADVPNLPPIPPNAPLLPYAIPPTHSVHHSTETSHHSRLPTASRRISNLHLYNASTDWRVPRSEDVIECLETLAYLSKYPKLRAFFNSTRFTPSLLHGWATPEDRTKEVNVFEIVERFTFTKHHPDNVCFWASIVMRHYSRKDDVVTKRQCGNFQCRQWETDDPGMKFICCPKCKYIPPLLQHADFSGVHDIVQKFVLVVLGQDIHTGVLIINVKGKKECRPLWRRNDKERKP